MAGMIADTMAEAHERSKNDPKTFSGVLLDLRKASVVELLTGEGGAVWVNIDGMCALRVQSVEVVITDTTKAKSTDKVV